MKTRTLLALCCLSAGALAVGCQESTAPANGYFATRSDRGMNIDSDSPSVPERSGAGLGAASGNEPQGSNAPLPAALRETAPPPASPAAPSAPLEPNRSPSTQPSSTGGVMGGGSNP